MASRTKHRHNLSTFMELCLFLLVELYDFELKYLSKRFSTNYPAISPYLSASSMPSWMPCTRTGYGHAQPCQRHLSKNHTPSQGPQVIRNHMTMAKQKLISIAHVVYSHPKKPDLTTKLQISSGLFTNTNWFSTISIFPSPICTNIRHIRASSNAF